MTTVSKWVIDNEQPAEGASFSSETHSNVRADLAEFMNQVSKCRLTQTDAHSSFSCEPQCNCQGVEVSIQHLEIK
jgi:hypothetical protein